MAAANIYSDLHDVWDKVPFFSEVSPAPYKGYPALNMTALMRCYCVPNITEGNRF